MLGVINVLKPPGMTSHDVVSWMRKTLGIKRVGHTGTLDPGVSGVLPICIGKATKLAQYITDSNKIYRGQLILGITTDTQDSFGSTIESVSAQAITSEQIEEAFRRFVGELEQIPPMVSAVKIKGQKLYELYRQGKVVTPEARKITIHYLKVLDIHQLGTDSPIVDFEASCSKGTYIRTLCHDIGNFLNVGGSLNHLIRIKSGPFYIDEAHTLAEIEDFVANKQWDKFIDPVTKVMSHWRQYQVDHQTKQVILHGNMVKLQQNCWINNDNESTDQVFVLDTDGNAIAFAKIKVFNNQTYIQPTTVIKEGD